MPEHHDLQRVQNRYELVRDSTGWPDMSDLSPDVRRGMETRLEETLTELRDRTLGETVWFTTYGRGYSRFP